VDSPTDLVHGGVSAEFTSVPGKPGAVDLVWARDAQRKPSPGAPGDLMPAGEDVMGRSVRARGPDGSSFLLEYRRDEVDPEDFPATWRNLNNKILQAIWKRRAVAQADSAGIGVDLGFDEHRPLLICKEKGALFHVPSPQTARLDTLDDCRDDDLLARLRLPLYSKSAARFLLDTTTVRTTGRPRLYTAARALPRDSVADVGDWIGFVRDIGKLVEPPRNAEPAVTALRGKFPCIGCDQVRRCFPPGGKPTPGNPVMARKRLHPVAFHPFHALAHRDEIVLLDEHIDILGGATWQAFRSQHVLKWSSAGVRLRREPLEKTVFARQEGVDPLTALTAKLGLFEAVAERVLAYHRQHGEPHLGLRPSSFASHELFVVRDKQPDITLREGMRGAMLDDILPAPPGPPIWLPPPDVEAPYAHPDIVRASEPRRTAPPDGAEIHRGGFRFGRGTQVRVTAGRVWENKEQRTAECELNLAGSGLSSVELAPSDRIHVEITSPGWEGTLVWCRHDHERMLGATEMPARSFPIKVTSAQVLDLQSAAQGRALFGKATVYRTYGAFYDVYSLGIMLLRTLLASSKHSMEKITADVLPSLSSFCRAISAPEGTSAFDALASVMQTVSRARPLDTFLKQSNVCYFPGEVQKSAGGAPRELWAELLAVVVAAVTTEPGVSFAETSRMERDPAAFCKPVEMLLERIRSIRKRLPTPSEPSEAETALPPSKGVPAAPSAEELLEAENRRLKEVLEAKVARLQRLEGDIQTLQRARAQTERRPEPRRQDSQADAVWRGLIEAVLGARVGSVPPPTPGSGPFELIKTLVVDGLQTQSVLMAALAELGGHEFANEQKNLARLVKRALRESADGGSGASKRVREAVYALRAVKGQLGGAIGMLVDAHGRSTQDGSRKMLATLDTAIRKELGLKGTQQRQLEDIMSRLRGSLGDLIAMLFDPVFEQHVRYRLTGRQAGPKRSGGAQ
jgi:hypothetical protein